MISATQVSPTTLKWVPLPNPISLPPPSQLVTRTISEPSGSPCRRCLTDGKVGETMYLIPYNPFPAGAKDSPYQGTGAIFVHSHECEKYSKSEISDQQRSRFLSVRAFDRQHMLANFTTLQGDGLVEKAEEMLADQNVAYLMVYYAGPGCFAVKVERG